MLALRRIGLIPLRQLKRLLDDNQIHVNPFTVKYKEHSIQKKETGSPLEFQWEQGTQVEPLYFGFYTWGTAESKKYPGTFLALGTSADFRIVGFPLYLLPQDKDFVYLSFKLGNNEGGKNRWFGRGRSSKELRSVAQTDQLAIAIRSALQEAFPEPLFTHPTLSGDWLLLARLPLADLQDKADLSQRVELKTLILKKLLQAFIIAEKLRDDSLKVVGMQASSTDTEDEVSSSPFMLTPLNQILYGPPGTGKTHHTKARAVGIIESLTDKEIADTYNREEIRDLFEDYRKTGQIEFVTFHQAFGYEDFVEGIKPILTDVDTEDIEDTTNAKAPKSIGYVLRDGVFKILAERGIYGVHLQKQHRLAESPSASKIPQPDFDSTFESFTDYLRSRLENEPLGSVIFQSKHKTRLVLQAVSDKGTAYFRYEKGFSDNLPQVTRNGLRKIDVDNPLAAQTDTADFLVKHGRDRTVYWAAFKEFVAFRAQQQAHQPQLDNQPNSTAALQRVTADPNIVSEIIQTIRIRDFARADYERAPRFVLIIDEINRGNVANIFGELITLLEGDKRAGRPEALTVKLPYSKEDFSVPENLYLLGTMNTADRSVEALDTALRRRFSFTEMRPEPQVIRDNVGENGVLEGIDVALLLEVLNSRLEQMLDRDHCLGHALLLRIGNLEELRAAFQRNILPLLQEYFFGDWGKIGLVLGPKFVTVVPTKADGRHALARFPGYDAAGLRDKPLYHLTEPAAWDAAAFQSIYATN